MNIKDLIKDNTVKFLFYQKKELWYEVYSKVKVYFDTETSNDFRTSYEPTGFRFSVPIEDCGDGRFLVEDKALIFMRYIRKALEEQKQAKDALQTD